MTETEEGQIDPAFETPPGKTLLRLLGDPPFCDAVVADPADALAGYELNDEFIAALTADAHVLAGPEVVGLAMPPAHSQRDLSGLETVELLRERGIASGDLGLGRVIGISSGDLGSGRIVGLSGLDLASGR